MHVAVVERSGARFLECAEPIVRVDDVLDLVAACAEHGARNVLVESKNLPNTFFELRSRFAGELLQKCQNYHLRLAAVFAPGAVHSESFEAFLVEARRGQQFRAFTNREDAERWLASE